MTPTIRRAASLAAGIALVVAACGSDSDSADDTVSEPGSAPVATDDELFTQVEDGGEPSDTDAEPSDTGDDTTSTTDVDDPTTTATSDDGATTIAPVDSESPTTVGGNAAGTGGGGGSSTNEDVQESLDDAGVDVDLEDLGDNLQDFNTGEGGGVVTVDGVAYEFVGELCVVDGGDFIVEGPGTTADGVPFWGSVSASSEFDFDGDGEPDDTLDIFIEVGKEELFGSGSDDLPDLSATKLDGAAMQLGEDIEYTIDGTRISGSGPIEDFNSVLVPSGETLPMTFEASCT